MSDSSAFHLLDERIQRYIWASGWESLREVQEAAIPLIVDAGQDVILAAATAAGKTEAAFLPALTCILQASSPRLIVYVSPLKALINDQFGRLSDLCDDLEIPVWRWHGDVSASMKTRFVGDPRGVLLITPESLEAVLCIRGTAVARLFGGLAFLVVDELHAFIGSERGKQLQSLLHRIEQAIGRPVPRIGLSATLGDMRTAAEFLRPGQGQSVAIVEAGASGSEIRILIRGYEEPLAIDPPGAEREQEEQEEREEQEQERETVTPGRIAADLYRALRGTNNLVFPNSRSDVERYTDLLARLCEDQNVPREFWPHHGNLSKEIRAETEEALRQSERPATAVCTNTLELGIDIGAVKSVAQIGYPPSVASLRQRLGRSGRREGEPAILRGYCEENAIGPHSSLADELRLRTVQATAMTLLMLEGWVEPPVREDAHFSTFVQQILAYVAQNGGATAAQVFRLLCAEGAPFEAVTKEEFLDLVRKMGELDLLIQDSAGTLLHGGRGERMVNHFSFYSAFATDEEFRIVAGGRTLGTLPISQALTVGQRILFAGRTWCVQSVDEEQRTIFVTSARGGIPPMFTGGFGRTHTRVRQRTRALLESAEVPPFLDEVAKRFLSEARTNYAARGLGAAYYLDHGDDVILLTWRGDATNEAVACMLRSVGWAAAPSGPGVEVLKGRHSIEEILDALEEFGTHDLPALDVLLASARNLYREKWDWALPQRLLHKAFASQCLDLEDAVAWIRGVSGRGKGAGA